MAGSWMKGRAFLFLEAGRRVYRCQFTKDLTLIGSDRSNDIVIRDDSIEANHAQITRAGSVYTLRAIDDAEVRVDGEEIEAGYELMNGNRIEIGDTDILFAREQSESPTTVHLLVRKPGEPPMGFWSKKSTIVIGREKGDVIVDDPLLSKVHAIVENFCHGGQFLLDARSERGTGLNGESIEARHRLIDGDLINLGTLEIEFRLGPLENPDAQDAAKLAAERIGELRRSGHRNVQSEPGGASAANAPRNPYQRYPSSIPDADPPPRQRRSAVDSDIDAEPTRSKRARSRDIKRGVQTGIVNVDPQAKKKRPERKPKRPGVSRVPSEVRPRRPDPTYEPEDLPNFKPRPHWGKAGKKGRGFGDRGPNELDTRISLGNADDSGLWYVPRGSDGPRPAKGAPKPIIRPRGDHVPESESAPDEAPSRSAPSPGRARIRRPAQGPRGPGSSPIRPMRATEGRSREPVPEAPAPRPRRSPDAPEAPQVAATRAPGARPDEKERWYIPEEDRKDVRQRRGEGAWYLPDGKKKKRPSGEDYADEYGDRHERPDRDKKGSGTQVFDGSDY